MHLRVLSGLVPGLLVAASLASPAQQLSTIPRQDFWVTDGAVNAIAVTNDRVFIGGDFRYVGPYTGGGVPVDMNTMQPVAKYPKVNGSVHAVEPDGQGGWFIGGEFTTVGGRPRTNLAHITAAGEVNTNWVVHATGGEERGRVNKLASDGDTLYATGSFTHLNGLPRPFVGALLSANGAVKAWAPQVDKTVLSIAVSPTAVYLGGRFFSMNGAERRYVGAVDKTSAETLPWNPYINPLLDFYFVTNTFPRALAVTDGLVIVPGRFANLFDYYGLVAFRENDSSIAWGAGKAESPRVFDLQTRGEAIYVVGSFGQIGGDGSGGHVIRDRVAALDALTGQVQDWFPKLGGTFSANAITFAGNTAYVGGTFNSLNPLSTEGPLTNAHHIAAFNLDTGEEVGPRRPFNNGWINALAAQGDQIYFGGVFDSVGGAPRQHLAELDRRDGSLKSWDVDVKGPVTALALPGNQLIVGGVFSSFAGQSRERLAALGLPDLQLLPWNPAVEGVNFIGRGIKALVPDGEALLVAGDFTGVGGQPRTNVALVSLTTGEALPWQANTDAPVESAVISGSTAYVGGRFTTLGGQSRLHLGSVDLATGQVSDWNPAPDNWVTSLSANAGAIYSAGYFRNVSGSARTGYAAHDLAGGALLPWNLEALLPSINDSHLLATDAAVYATGFFRHLDPVWGPNLVAVTPDTGSPTSWDTRPLSYLTPVGLHREGNTLFIMGDHLSAGGPKRMGLAVYEPEGFSMLTRLTPGGTSTHVRLSGDQGREFVLERTADFGAWSGVSTNIAWEGVLELEDPAAPNNSPAFYRARTSQP
jgi:trimeric autotransporter adhesin